MKQFNLFNKGVDDTSQYSLKIEPPTYEPKYQKPHLLELVDKSKTKRLLKEIDQSNLPYDEKTFLMDAARRHNVFNYEKIADYYANSSPEMQRLMERSALVIIDFEQAIELGYVQLSEEIKKTYLNEYNDE